LGGSSSWGGLDVAETGWTIMDDLVIMLHNMLNYVKIGKCCEDCSCESNGKVENHTKRRK